MSETVIQSGKFAGAPLSAISTEDLGWARRRGGLDAFERQAIKAEIKRRRYARKPIAHTRRRIQNEFDALVLSVR